MNKTDYYFSVISGILSYEILDASFLEKEVTDMLYLYCRAKYRDCDIDHESLPVPTRLVLGISELSDAPAIVGLDSTVRIRRYK